MSRTPTTAEEALRGALGGTLSDEPSPQDDGDGEADRELADVWADLGLTAGAVEPRAIARDRLLRSALGHERYSREIREGLQRLYALSDAELGDLLDRINSAEGWTATPMPGLHMLSPKGGALPFGPEAAGTLDVLVRLEPGTPFPRHEHLGDEMVLVVEGGFTTDDGKSVRAGQSLAMPRGSTHAFVADEGEDCITATQIVDGIRFA